LNMKKYSKIMAGIVFLVCLKVIISRPIVITIVKEKTSWINIPVCLQSETILCFTVSFLFSGYDSKLRLINFFLGRFTFVE
ncbi:hypothetical protein JEG39_10760, partial [Streptococcus agalactiae]|nr:hypothetical protein [Streptococcus agalactiae]